MPHAPAPAAPPLVLVNARLVDPASGRETRGGVLVKAYGRSPASAPPLTAASAPEGARMIDCCGDVVAPGFIDMRAFVGEPGAEHRETIASASAAAAAPSGVTTLIATPTTSPADRQSRRRRFPHAPRARPARVRILPSAAITKGLAGQEMAEIGLLREAGAVAFSDGPHSIANSGVLRRAMTYARDFDALIMHYCGGRGLAGGVAAGEGALASRLGLSGVPARGGNRRPRPRPQPRRADRRALSRGLRRRALSLARCGAPRRKGSP